MVAFEHGEPYMRMHAGIGNPHREQIIICASCASARALAYKPTSRLPRTAKLKSSCENCTYPFSIHAFAADVTTLQKLCARSQTHTHSRADENISLFGRTPNLQLYAGRANKLAPPRTALVHMQNMPSHTFTNDNIYAYLLYTSVRERVKFTSPVCMR